MRAIIIRQPLELDRLAKMLAQWRTQEHGGAEVFIICKPSDPRYRQVRRLEAPLIHIVSRAPIRSRLTTPHIAEVTWYETIASEGVS